MKMLWTRVVWRLWKAGIWAPLSLRAFLIVSIVQLGDEFIREGKRIQVHLEKPQQGPNSTLGTDTEK